MIPINKNGRKAAIPVPDATDVWEYNNVNGAPLKNKLHIIMKCVTYS